MTFVNCEVLEGRRFLSGYDLTPLSLSTGPYVADWVDIGNNGMVAGSSGLTAVYRTSAGRINRIGNLPGDLESYSTGVNNLSDVVGYDVTPKLTREAFLFHAGRLSKLPGPADGGAAEAHAINDSGLIVGTATPRTGKYVMPAFWKDGKLQLIGKAGVDSGAANDVNASGQIVGQYHTTAFVYANGQVKDLGAFSAGGYSMAFGINDGGQVVGASALSGMLNIRAALWSGGKMRNLGVLPGDAMSLAYDINKSGTIVGQSWSLAGGYRAVIWQGGAITDLNSLLPGSNVKFVDAQAINDAGQIVAVGMTGGGERGLYLLSPQSLHITSGPSSPSAAPAPKLTQVPTPIPTPTPVPVVTSGPTGQRGLIHVTIGDPPTTKRTLLRSL